MASTTSTTSTTSAAPLTGLALIAHHATRENLAAAVMAAGYHRPDGRPAYTTYYEAILEARGLTASTAAIAAPHEAAAAAPLAWHGHQLGGPVRIALLTVTDANDQPVGAALPLAMDHQGWSTDEEIQSMEARIIRHAEHYANAAQGPDPFPLTVTLADRGGSVSLFEIDADGDVSDDLGDGLRRCDRCGEIHNEDDGSTVNTREGWGRFSEEQWCNDCVENYAATCDDCGERYPSDELHHTGDNTDVCQPCIEESWNTCADCGDLHRYDDCETVDESDTVCRYCIERGNYYAHPDGGYSTEPPDEDDDDEGHRGPEGMRRYGYHTDANDTLGHTIPQTGHTYGCEVEYKGSPTDWPAIAAACQNRAILTNDSTVSGELVSVALTAGQIRRWLAATTAALTGSRNDTETGMHVHVDKRALSPWQWFTLSHYAAEHADTLETIAGRPAGQWSNLRSLPADTWPTFARRWKHRNWPTRYAGINYSKGPTIEWRINRATKTPARALARFGMIQRLTALGRLAYSQRPQTAAELRGWLAQDRHIQEVTGWEVGEYNYRAAMQQSEQLGDQPPAAPTREAIAAQQETMQRLQADLRLTEQLRLNARRQAVNSPYDGGTPYTRDAWSRYEHYLQHADRIQRQVWEQQDNLDAAVALFALGNQTN